MTDTPALRALDALIAEENKHVQTQLIHAWLDNYLETIRSALSPPEIPGLENILETIGHYVKHHAGLEMTLRTVDLVVLLQAARARHPSVRAVLEKLRKPVEENTGPCERWLVEGWNSAISEALEGLG